MEYSQPFSLTKGQISGELSIDYPSTQVGTDKYISGLLELSMDQRSSSGQRVRLKGENGLIVSPAIIEIQDEEMTFELEVYLPPNVSTVAIGIEPELDDVEEDSTGEWIHFEDLTVLSIGAEIFREETFEKQSFRRRVDQHMNSDGSTWPLINFADELSKYTDFETFVEILAKFINEYRDVRDRADSILTTVLKRALLGKIGEGRHQMRHLSQFESAIEKLSETHTNASVDPTRAVEYALQELDDKRELEELVKLSYELRIIDLYPEAINTKVFYILLAEEILRQSEDGARNIVDQYFSNEQTESIDQETYEQLKSDALEEEDETASQSKWYKLLSHTQTSVDISEFKFITSNLLLWTAEVNADKKSYYHVTPKLYHAASTWFDSLEISFAHRCYHEYNLRQGLYLFHDEKYSESSEYFSTAISVGSNQSGEYEKPQPGWLEFPIIYKTLADARNLNSNSNKEQATELLQQRREILEDLTSVSDESKDRILSAIGGERFRILADIFLEKGEYERAEEVLGRAIGLFKQGNLERSAEITLRRKLEVGAVLREVNGDFRDAARLHNDIADDSRYTEGQQFVHGIRSDICRVKERTSNEQYDEAIEILKEINRRTNQLENDARELGILLRLLSNYRDNEVSNASRALEKLANQQISTQSSHPLDVEYDYTEPIIVVLALQRLKQTELPQDLLNALVDLSVQRALTPKQGGEIVDETYLGDISIDRLWRERLPSIVLNRIERIQLDSATITGNYKSVTLLLAELLEFYLALIVEYHGKSYWGDNWRSELTTEDEDENNLSIGVLARIFNSGAATTIENSNELNNLYFSEVNNFNNFTEMRNHYDHAYEGYIEEDTFSKLREWVFDFLRESVQDSPVIISVEDENAFGIYSIRLHWWRGQRKILLDTEASLETGAFYYLPAETILNLKEQVVQSVDEAEISKVDDQRVIDQVRELPQYQ